ncbi:Cro/Cl family transcriptional regulator [Actinomyces sp. 432]|nr:helix-turn-helix domain-containing protein [Actinomyces sp. 565]MBW3068171.1 helix-turn-helix domain-containing protein [Actinomyces sp. 594]NDR53719.1 helix-turn-helix domain-containing protein [Actinomyces sp. 565]QHO91098.1 Cro/Cl family transcriptional regulator [Actinomyces sp. 432]
MRYHGWVTQRTEREWIRFRRHAAGLSQRELADRTGVSQPLIAAIESGARRASRSTLQRLTQALQVRPSDLLHAARQDVIELAAAHGCQVIGVFGSVASGTDRQDSDIDLIVRFPEHADILDLLELEEELSDLLTVPVDVISASSGSVAMSGTSLEPVRI